MNAVANAKSNLPNLKNDGRMHVRLGGNHFQQNKVIIPNNNNAINIYCVYKLDPIASRKMLLIIQKIIINIKDMVYVLMKEVNLVIQ